MTTAGHVIRNTKDVSFPSHSHSFPRIITSSCTIDVFRQSHSSSATAASFFSHLNLIIPSTQQCRTTCSIGGVEKGNDDQLFQKKRTHTHKSRQRDKTTRLLCTTRTTRTKQRKEREKREKREMHRTGRKIEGEGKEKLPRIPIRSIRSRTVAITGPRRRCKNGDCRTGSLRKR